eukprot:6223413-Amphidinium_carterae.1
MAWKVFEKFGCVRGSSLVGMRRMLFEVFDQDGNGQVDHWEFLRVVFPEYYYDVRQLQCSFRQHLPFSVHNTV